MGCLRFDIIILNVVVKGTMVLCFLRRVVDSRRVVDGHIMSKQ